MKKFFVLLCLIWGTYAFAQTPSDSAKVRAWKHSLVGAVTTTQISFQDWAQGGEDALAWTALLDGKSNRETPVAIWANTYKMAYGKTKLGSQGLRKTDDRIELESVLTRKLGIYVNPFISATFKTQFNRGYAYDAKGVGIAVSDFLDPGYLTQAIGLGYQPAKEVKARLGVALREVFTNHFNKYSDNPKTIAIEKSLVEGGLESVINMDFKLAENMLFSSTIELFDAFKKMDEVILRSNNNLTIKAGKLVTVIMNVQLIQEKRITPRTQVKESLSIGFSYTFL
jgi:hypothetical protein